MSLSDFKHQVITGITRDDAGDPIFPEEWSGFAIVTKEGGSQLYSASLKREITGDPRLVKPAYQRQIITGYSLLNVESVSALFGDTSIQRTQIVFRHLSAQEIRNQIASLQQQLASLST